MSAPDVPDPLSMVHSGEVQLSPRIIGLAMARSLGAVALTLVIYAVIPIRDITTARFAGALAVLGLVGITFVFVRLLARVNRSSHPGMAAIEALVLIIGMFLVLFATMYVALWQTDPASFSQPLDRVAGIYFSVTVLVTVGFGDISAVSDLARITVTIQMILDVALIGAAVKLLSSSARHAFAASVGASSPSPDDEGGSAS